MEFLILISVWILILIGFMGIFIPILPGPPISYIGVLILHFFTNYQLDESLLFLLGFIVVIITFIDYYLQIYGVEKYGGGKKATNGAIIGLIIGMFIPPLGLLVGPFFGAYIGARIEGSNKNALRVAFGAIVGFLAGTLLKLVVNIFILYQVIILLYD